MIISASRRTDIPAYYPEWLLKRIEERYVYVRNPMNMRRVSGISLDPDLVDCIVFWSKNPKPMLDKLHLLKDYAYYFQFTLNPYDGDIETGLPRKNEITGTFKKLSGMIGPQKVIWRYDPVLLNEKYTVSYHIDKFSEFAGNLKGYTEKAVFSFIDFYKKTAKNTKPFLIRETSAEEKKTIAVNFSRIAKENRLLLEACAEDIDLSEYGIARARCVDDRLIAKISGRDFAAKKDRNQRPACGCVKSVDIGEYNSCLNGCVYCYANFNQTVAANNIKKHNASSPLLTGNIENNDTIIEK
jgi:hypothetical protein